MTQEQSPEKKIKVRRTVTFIYESPFNSMYYPDMSLEEAITFEKETSFETMSQSIDYEVERDMVTVTVLDDV